MQMVRGIQCFFARIGTGFINFFRIMADGDAATRLSFFIMGFGCMVKGQLGKGITYLLAEILYVLYIVLFGWQYLQDFNTLGVNTQGQVFDESLQIYIYTQGDNSLLILLFSVVSIAVTIFFLFVYIANVRAAYRAQQQKAAGLSLPTFKDDLQALTDKNLHKTLLTLPALGVLLFTVLPLLFMILMAFTNFNRDHQPPGNLFTWVGLENFRNVFWQNPLMAQTFIRLLGWTLVWAFFATFSNYVLGMILAVMINKKGIHLKKMWRTFFVTTIAVPQFVTLLLMSRLLHELGPVNVLLQNMGWITEPIKFLTDANNARITVILVNIWVGVPYTLLITTGILLNIPEDIYESARIDGAGPVKTFTKITLPYMLFVTTPYLITQFVGNINNFNVIYLLSGGGPMSLDYYRAGKTDLLVTWLYKLTVNEQDYSLASTIGILIFIIVATFSLIFYNKTGSVRREEEFQ